MILINQLDSEKDKVIKFMKGEEATFNDTIKDTVNKFRNEIYDNIPIQFGNYLSEALGETINSKRTSVLNKEFFAHTPHGQHIMEAIKTNNMTIEETVIANLKENNNSHYYKSNSDCIYLTVGKDFGVSYLTANTQRINTMYFDKTKYFTYLTQGHVDLIKDSRKRECAAAFVKFRDDFIQQITPIHETLIDINIPIKKQQVKQAVISNKYDRYAYRNTTDYMLLGNAVDDTINEVYIGMPNFKIWDGYTNPNNACKYEDHGVENFLSVVFLQTDTSQKSGGTNIRIVANIDISGKSVQHTLNSLYDGNHGLFQQQDDNRFSSSSTIIRNKYTYVSVLEPDGIPIGLNNVFKNPQLQKEINDRINFYVTASKTLQLLKEEFADLYFVHANI